MQNQKLASMIQTGKQKTENTKIDPETQELQMMNNEKWYMLFVIKGRIGINIH